MNDCQKIVSGYLNPAPVYECELVNIKNQKDEDDSILLFHIEPAMNYIEYCSIPFNSVQYRSIPFGTVQYCSMEV